jgi:hypothetical protein
MHREGWGGTGDKAYLAIEMNKDHEDQKIEGKKEPRQNGYSK